MVGTIRHESELPLHFREFLPEDPDLRWPLPTDTGQPRLDHVDLELDCGRRNENPLNLKT